MKLYLNFFFAPLAFSDTKFHENLAKIAEPGQSTLPFYFRTIGILFWMNPNFKVLHVLTLMTEWISRQNIFDKLK